MSDADGTRSDYVAALARGLDVIGAFADREENLTLTEIAKIVNLSRATVRRNLITLVALGYVEERERYFRLAPKILTLARAYLSSNMLPRVAAPFLESISEQLGEPCSISILHGTEVIYVGRSTNKRLAALMGDVGSRRPAYCTSMGRVLLANLNERELDHYFSNVTLRALTKFTLTDEAAIRQVLEKVRKQEYCLSDQETEMDLRTIAIPLRNAAGKVVATLHVATQASRTTKRTVVETFLPVLRKAAAEIRPLLI